MSRKDLIDWWGVRTFPTSLDGRRVNASPRASPANTENRRGGGELVKEVAQKVFFLFATGKSLNDNESGRMVAKGRWKWIIREAGMYARTLVTSVGRKMGRILSFSFIPPATP